MLLLTLLFFHLLQLPDCSHHLTSNVLEQVSLSTLEKRLLIRVIGLFEMLFLGNPGTS